MHPRFAQLSQLRHFYTALDNHKIRTWIFETRTNETRQEEKGKQNEPKVQIKQMVLRTLETLSSFS